MVVRTRARLGSGGTLLTPKPTASTVGANRIRWPEGSWTIASVKGPNGDCVHRPTTARRPEPVPIPAMCPSKIQRCP